MKSYAATGIELSVVYRRPELNEAYLLFTYVLV